MVAYTSPDCLPYFECDDSACLNTGTVCDPSTVFCDLVNLIEGQLVTIDNVIARTATAIPLAKVARNALFILNTNLPGYDTRIPWDTVLEDNNDMVNLDIQPKAVLVSVPGIYYVSSYVVGAPPATVSNVLNHTVGTGVGTFLAQNDTLWRANSNYSNLALETQVSAAQIAAAGGSYPLATMVDFQGTVGNGLLAVSYAEMTVYWVADI